MIELAKAILFAYIVAQSIKTIFIRKYLINRTIVYVYEQKQTIREN